MPVSEKPVKSDSRRLHHSTRSLRSLAHGALSNPERPIVRRQAEGESKGTIEDQPATEEDGALSERMNAGESKGTKVHYHDVYILRCADGTLYVGSTDDLVARMRAHNGGRGALYTARRRPVSLAYSESHPTRLAARRREAQIKRWTTVKKEALIAGDRATLHELARRVR